MQAFKPSLLSFLFALSTPAYSKIDRGEVIYKQLCFNCHGVNLDGGIGPSLTDSYWKHGDTPEEVLKAIDKGNPGTEMIAYELVFPKEDREALRDFIISKQEGMRSVVRSVYPREFFKGKRLGPKLFDSVESSSQTRLPENVYYMEKNADGVLRGTSKLYLKDEGKYHFSIRPIGRTSIFVNGEEVHYSDAKTDKKTHFNKKIDLNAGVHDLEILHEEKTTHGYKFFGYLQKVDGIRIPLSGRSLEGSVPKFIKPGPEAKVARKWIVGLPPRALLCLLPNKVLVAYDTESGKVLQAWNSAEVNQTPSLPGRSQSPSEIKGTPIPGQEIPAGKKGDGRFLRYETQGPKVLITNIADGKEEVLTISPKGTDSFEYSVK